jgi:two-component system, NarL family, sensor kinase
VLPPLPAATEVAAHRIATEALTNAVRHAAPTRIDVTISMATDGLAVEIRDDGRGLPTTPTDGTSQAAAATAADARPSSYREGVGLTSMRERAEELGGPFHLAPAEPHGSIVRAFLPVDATTDATFDRLREGP